MLTETELWHLATIVVIYQLVRVSTHASQSSVWLWRSRRCKRRGNEWYMQAGEQSNFDVDGERKTSTVTRTWKHALTWHDFVISVNEMLLYDIGPGNQSNYGKCLLNWNYDMHLATIMEIYQ